MIRANKTLGSFRMQPMHSTSVAAIGVAAHECGHAVQHANGYAPLKIRGSSGTGGKFWIYIGMAIDIDWIFDSGKCICFAD